MRHALLLYATGTLTFLVSCSTGPTPSMLLHESERGTVSLEALPSGSLQARHPISLPTSTLGLVLGGFRMETERGLLQSIVAGEAVPEPIFSQEETTFLAPLLSRALEQATPSEVIRFTLLQTTKAGPQTTGGALFVVDDGLAFTVTQYRTGPSIRRAAGKGRPGYPPLSGLQRRTLTFVPSGVERELSPPLPSGLGGSQSQTLVIDYTLLRKLKGLEDRPPGSDSTTTADGENTDATRESLPAQSSLGAVGGMDDSKREQQEIQSLKDLVIEKDLEIQGLQEELRNLRRRLAAPDR